MDPADSTRLLSLVDAFASKRVLVVGDLIADEFIYGEVSRVSREAPVLILKYDTTEVVPGGAGNAANNVAALGARASLAGMVGTDPEGKRLMSTFPRTVDVRQVVREEFAALYQAVERDSGASKEEIHRFFAEGMLLNVAAALEIEGSPETWSLSGFLKHQPIAPDAGGAS